MSSSHVTASDRLSFTLFLALAVHGLVIFGINFVPDKPRDGPHSLEVTLAVHQDAPAPDEADFIAQADQLGSGDQETKKELTTDQQAPFMAPDAQEVPAHSPAARLPQAVASQKVVVTRARSAREASDRQNDRQPDPSHSETSQDATSAMGRRIATLQARLAAQKQAYAQRPRIRRVTSVSTKASYEALYIDRFRRRVEEMGTQHFPRQALRSQTFGSVRLMVAIQPQGKVREVRILKSSGHGFLDQAAVQSVRLAAPFPPFTAEMRKHMDRLEIIRTWKFDARHRVTTR